MADLSTGNKRKVGLIQAFMHRPELLILDEPTSGLDPLVQHEFYHLLDEARDAGQTVFLSSHVLPEVQRVCDRVAFVREGGLVAVEDVAELTGKAVREIEVVFAEPVSASVFEGVPGVTDVATDGKQATTLRFTVTGSLDPVVKKLGEHQVVDLISRLPDLEDVFMTFYAGSAGERTRCARPQHTRRATMLRNAFTKGLRDQARPLLMWAIGAAFYVALLMAIYPSIRKSAGAIQEYVNNMPAAVKAAFLGSGDFSPQPATSTRSCSRGSRRSCSSPSPIAVAGRSLAGEEESGTLSLLLANAVGRRRLVLQKYAAMLVVVAVLGAAFGLSLVIATRIAGTPVGADKLAEAFVRLTLLGLAIGSVTFAVGGATGRRQTGIAAGAAVGVAMYLLNTLSVMNETIRPLRYVSLFHYAGGASPLGRGLDAPRACWCSLATSAALLAATLWLFERRDVRV